jgi:heme-degrading monooxygenase HmoA
MVVTVFRARVRPEVQTEYMHWASRMSALAKEMPGAISHKGFVAEDEERITVVEFESEETHRAGRVHPKHVAAKKPGRQDFSLEYRMQMCQGQRESAFPKKCSAEVCICRSANAAQVND